jgi:hypothetical protein
MAQAAASMGDWHWDIPAGRVRWSPQVESLHDLEPNEFAGSFEGYSRSQPRTRALDRHGVSVFVPYVPSQPLPLAAESLPLTKPVDHSA